MTRRMLWVEVLVAFALIVWANVLNARGDFRPDPVAWAFFPVLVFFLILVLIRAMGVIRVTGVMSRRHEFEARMPESFHFLSEDDNGIATVAVTRVSGEVVTVQTPAGYHPSEDGGQLLVKLACPELFEDNEFNLEFAPPRIIDIGDDDDPRG